MLSVQLFFFLGVIFLLAGTSAPETPGLSASSSLAFGALICLVHLLASWRAFASAHSPGAWFRAERQAFALAFASFVALLYGLDLKYWLQPLTFFDKTEGLADLAGLALFFALLSLSWLAGRSRFQVFFGGALSPPAFVWQQTRQNLPLVLPWILIAVAVDVLRLLLPEALLSLVPAPWDEFLVFALFLAFLLILLPPLILRLWACRPIPEGPFRMRIAAFCAAQNFRAGLYFWPLMGGQALTAAILGLLPRLRYLLFTPALAETLGEAELQSVIAHEIGHVYHHHLLWYAAIFCGFSLTLAVLAPLAQSWIMASALFPLMMRYLPLSPETLADAITAVPLLALVLLYFRFVFGFFLRNFERQADSHVFRALGTAGPLVSAFFVIARACGGRRERHNWHHFSLDERVAWLNRCESEPALVGAQHRRIRRALALYFLILACLCGLGLLADRESLAARAENQYTETVLQAAVQRSPEGCEPLLDLADFYAETGRESAALSGYEAALSRPEGQCGKALRVRLWNNLAWLLLSAETPGLRNRERALSLADRAAAQAQNASVLDTLATALWANERPDLALHILDRAARLDPQHVQHYDAQRKRFRGRWQANP